MEKTAQTDNRREILGVLFMAMGVLLFIGLVSYHPEDYPNSGSPRHVQNWLGLVGAMVSHFLYTYTLGYACLVFPFLVFLFGWYCFLQRGFRPFLRIGIAALFLAVYGSTVLALRQAMTGEEGRFGYRFSGLFGGFLAEALVKYLGTVGSVVVLFTLLVLFLLSVTSWSMRETARVFVREISGFVKAFSHKRKAATPSIPLASDFFKPDAPIEIVRPPDMSLVHPPLEGGEKKRSAVSRSGVVVPPLAGRRPGEPTEKVPSQPKASAIPPGPYILPPLDLLSPPQEADWMVDPRPLERKARFLEEKLAEFGVEGTVTGIQPGPVITRFEVSPAPGVKVSRFIGIQDDLALVMRASRVRIVAPIPGKAAVGIEIPNEKPATVALREILASPEIQKAPSRLTIALGKTTEGRPYVTDLAQLPHLLVAGATGSGKSVCLNTLITSILFRCRPDEVKFVLIDPKKLELSLYQDLRHHHLTTGEGLDEPVITTVEGAVAVLRSTEREMERRYRILARLGVRNIEDFNALLKKPRPPDDPPLERLPYVVLVVDELADLMMTGAREIEEPIARLAQMSRAVGIHLILATQRPSVDVITGVIKANFPARIAFQVTSKTDSRTILDRNGAEKLLGRGDMLFLHPREPEPIRIHGAFMTTEEVQRVVAFVREQPPAQPWYLPGLGGGVATPSGGEEVAIDDLFWEAARLVVRHQQGSASLLQRRLRVGYARAGRLIDALEEMGIVGPFDGSKAREVLVDEEGLERLRRQHEEEQEEETEPGL